MSWVEDLSKICSSDWYTFLGGVVVSCLGFTVIKIVELSSVNRAEFNSEIDKTVTLLADLTKEASLYWSLDQQALADSKLKEQGIKASLTRISRSLASLKSSKKNFSNLADQLYFNLYVIITGGNFESARRLKDESRLERLVFLGLDLELELNKCKIKKHMWN